MRKFIITLSCFAALLAIMFAIIEVGLLYRPNIYSYKYQYAERHLKDIKVLLLGSSHIEEGVKPELVGENTFNLAISARLKEYDAALAESLVPRMDGLQAVVMPVDYTNFFFGREKHNPSEKKAPVDLLGTCRCMHTKYMGTRIDPIWYWSEILNSKLNFMSRFWNKAQVLQECDSLGYVKLDVRDRKPNWEHRALPALLDPTLPIDRKDYQATLAVYESIARVTRRQGVRLILVSTPVYKTYHKSIHPMMLADMKRFIADIRRRYPNVEYYDFLYDSRFLPDDFNDSSHLTESGAVKFSGILAEVITRHHK